MASVARADMYTWVDAAGNLNVGNVTPPAEARIVKVVREDPAEKARADAARAAALERADAAAREAAHQAEVNALEARIADLERTADAQRNAAPVYVAAAPSPQVVVVTPPPPVESDFTTFSPLTCAWVGCPIPLVTAFPVVVPRRHVRHPREWRGGRGMVQRPGRMPRNRFAGDRRR
jgi:hypothetical protein